MNHKYLVEDIKTKMWVLESVLGFLLYELINSYWTNFQSCYAQ